MVVSGPNIGLTIPAFGHGECSILRFGKLLACHMGVSIWRGLRLRLCSDRPGLRAPWRR